MDFLLDLLQSIGIGAGAGLGTLGLLLVGVLARGDLGIDFERTSFDFMEEPFFLAVLVVLVVLTIVFATYRRDWLDLVLAAALGGLFGAASMADRGHPEVVGALAGALAALLAALAIRSLFARVRKRLDEQAARALPAYGEGLSLAAAGLSVLFPPLALVVVGVLAWLLAGSRRREGEKYAGLRVLR